MIERVESINENIMCVLLYLGKQGFAPELEISREDKTITLGTVEGPRLTNLLERGNERLPELYRSLGGRVAVISKYGVVYRNLSSDDVIAHSSKGPVIINWENGVYLPSMLETLEKCLRWNGDDLLRATKQHTDPQTYVRLENAFWTEFKDQFTLPVERTYRQLYADYMQFKGIPTS